MRPSAHRGLAPALYDVPMCITHGLRPDVYEISVYHFGKSSVKIAETLETTENYLSFKGSYFLVHCLLIAVATVHKSQWKCNYIAVVPASDCSARANRIGSDSLRIFINSQIIASAISYIITETIATMAF